MKTMTLHDGVSLLTMNVEGILFEGIWEMPHGVTLNSYIVKGQETAIIDGFCGWDGFPESLFKLLDEVDVELDSIRYLIINHMEPDHSGWIEDFRKIHSNFEIYCTKESADLLKAFYGHDQGIHVITDGDRLDLGDGKVFSFHKTPNIHWPDTMMTFEEQSGILFSCDAFGAFGKLDKHLSSEMTEEELQFAEAEQLRYYANILGSFSPMVQKGIEKVEKLPLKMIAPGHGMVWDKDLDRIIDDYKRYVRYQRGDGKRKVLILWGSMYGMTEKVVHYVENTLKDMDVPVVSLKASDTDLGNMLKEAWDASGIIVAAPTYEYKMFPTVAAMLDELGRKRVHCRRALYMGSYGWSGGALKEYDEIIKRNMMRWNTLDAIEFKGEASDEVRERIDAALKNLVNCIACCEV